MGLFYFSLFIVFVCIISILFFVYRELCRRSGLKVYQFVIIMLFGACLGGFGILLESNNIINFITKIILTTLSFMKIMIIDMLIVFILSFVIVNIKAIIKSKYRMHLLVTKLDPQKFLQEIDKEIKKFSSIKYNRFNKKILKNNLKYIESLKFQKSIALKVQGHFNEAQILRNEIDMTKFDATYIKIVGLYNINTIYPFRNQDEAIAIFLENEVKINEWLKIKKLKLKMMSIKAVYNFYIDNLEESKRLLNEILKNKISKLTYVETEYLLALIDIKEGREEEGRKRLSALLEPTKKIYLHDVITKQLES